MKEYKSNWTKYIESDEKKRADELDTLIKSGGNVQYTGKTEVKPKIMYDMPSNFDLKGLDTMQTITDDIVKKQADELDRMVFNAMKDGYKYIIRCNNERKFDIETGVFTSTMQYLPLYEEPSTIGPDTILLQPVADRLTKLNIDYMNMSYEETHEAINKLGIMAHF